MSLILSSSLTGWESLGVLALATTSVGVWLNWQRHEHLADIEEDVKNLKLTEEEAWHRSRAVNRRASLVLMVGLGMMLVATAGLFA